MKKLIPILSVSLLVSFVSYAGEEGHFFRDPLPRDKHFRDKVVHGKKPEVLSGLFESKPDDNEAKIQILDGVLKSVSLSSNASLKVDHIGDAFKKYIGKKIGDREATEIIEKTKDIYRDQGFLLPKVTFGGFNGGDFKINVLEGKIRDIRLEIEKEHEKEIMNNSLLKTYIKRIVSSAPARTKDIQRQVLLIGKIPGYDAKYGLVPISSSKKEELADMVVSIKVRRAKLETDVTNHGSSELGKYQFSAFSQIFNPTKHNDSLLLSLGTTSKPSKMQLVTAGYLKRLNSHGTSASILVSHSRDKAPQSTGTSGSADTSNTIRGQISHYLVLNNKNSARLDLGIEHRSIKEKDATQTLSDYNYNLGFIGGKIKHKDFLGGESWLNPMFFKTLGKAKLTRVSSALTNFDRDFALFTLDAFREQPLPKNFSLFKQLIWHNSSDKVPNEHQFFVGSHTIGRGYKSGLINANKGINFDAELRYNHFLQSKYIELVQPFAYYDISSFSKPLQTVSKKTLSSAGGGLRVFSDNGFRAEAEVGFPFTKNVTVGGADKRSSTKFQFLLGRSFEW